jgi:hypothetical protein
LKGDDESVTVKECSIERVVKKSTGKKITFLLWNVIRIKEMPNTKRKRRTFFLDITNSGRFFEAAQAHPASCQPHGQPQ